MNKFFSWLFGMGIGAGVMYLMDPERGWTRRTKIRDQVTHMRNQSDDAINTAMNDLRNRVGGMRTQISNALNNNSMISDMPPQAVGGAGQGTGMEGMPAKWSPSTRLAAGVGGGLLWLYGVNRKGLIGTALSAAGLGLAVRGISNAPVGSLIGMGNKEAAAIDVNKSIHIDVPVHDVYEFWNNFTNFPKFMNHLQSVTDLGNGHTHWIAKGPAGVDIEWDAVETQSIPDDTIAWESVPGSQIMTRGHVKFRTGQGERGGTQVNVHMLYTPPGGVLGHAVASLFGDDPKSAMDQDLNKLKTLLEKGKTTKGGQEVKPEDITQ